MFRLNLSRYSKKGARIPAFQTWKSRGSAPLFLITPSIPLSVAEIISTEQALGLTVNLFEIDPFSDLNLAPTIFQVTAFGFEQGFDRTKTIQITSNGFEIIVPQAYTSTTFSIEAFLPTQIINGQSSLNIHPDAQITGLKNNGIDLDFSVSDQTVFIDLPNGLVYLDANLSITITSQASFYPVAFWLLFDTFEVASVTIDGRKYDPLLDFSPRPQTYRYNPESSILVLFE